MRNLITADPPRAQMNIDRGLRPMGNVGPWKITDILVCRVDRTHVSSGQVHICLLAKPENVKVMFGQSRDQK